MRFSFVLFCLLSLSVLCQGSTLHKFDVAFVSAVSGESLPASFQAVKSDNSAVNELIWHYDAHDVLSVCSSGVVYNPDGRLTLRHHAYVQNEHHMSFVPLEGAQGSATLVTTGQFIPCSANPDSHSVTGNTPRPPAVPPGTSRQNKQVIVKIPVTVGTVRFNETTEGNAGEDDFYPAPSFFSAGHPPEPKDLLLQSGGGASGGGFEHYDKKGMPHPVLMPEASELPIDISLISLSGTDESDRRDSPAIPQPPVHILVVIINGAPPLRFRLSSQEYAALSLLMFQPGLLTGGLSAALRRTTTPDQAESAVLNMLERVSDLALYTHSKSQQAAYSELFKNISGQPGSYTFTLDLSKIQAHSEAPPMNQLPGTQGTGSTSGGAGGNTREEEPAAPSDQSEDSGESGGQLPPGEEGGGEQRQPPNGSSQEPPPAYGNNEAQWIIHQAEVLREQLEEHDWFFMGVILELPLEDLLVLTDRPRRDRVRAMLELANQHNALNLQTFFMALNAIGRQHASSEMVTALTPWCANDISRLYRLHNFPPTPVYLYKDGSASGALIVNFARYYGTAITIPFSTDLAMRLHSVSDDDAVRFRMIPVMIHLLRKKRNAVNFPLLTYMIPEWGQPEYLNQFNIQSSVSFSPHQLLYESGEWQERLKQEDYLVRDEGRTLRNTAYSMILKNWLSGNDIEQFHLALGVPLSYYRNTKGKSDEERVEMLLEEAGKRGLLTYQNVFMALNFTGNRSVLSKLTKRLIDDGKIQQDAIDTFSRVSFEQLLRYSRGRINHLVLVWLIPQLGSGQYLRGFSNRVPDINHAAESQSVMMVYLQLEWLDKNREAEGSINTLANWLADIGRVDLKHQITLLTKSDITVVQPLPSAPEVLPVAQLPLPPYQFPPDRPVPLPGEGEEEKPVLIIPFESLSSGPVSGSAIQQQPRQVPIPPPLPVPPQLEDTPCPDCF